ncbi:tRNA (adenosine(37)-N6)-threonylcarbamoyltransferase complex dimerization subunit type 1 TsaB [Candidatus Omnitrophota bacterium]
MSLIRNILSIDTTSRAIDVVLWSNGRVFSIQRDTRLDNYEGIACLIESVLKKANLSLSHIDYFGVCTGPGSFTGMRIGLSTMKALAYSLSKPLIGFGSLDIIAYMAKNKYHGLLCVMQDAKRNNIYSAVFSNNKSLRRVSSYLLLEPTKILKRLKKLHRNTTDLYFCGDVVSLYKDQIKISFPNSKILSFNDVKLKGRAIISLTKENARNESNPFELLPFYMYPKDCQVRKSSK